MVLTTESKRFGGKGRLDENGRFFSYPHDYEGGCRLHYMQIYNVNRAATVYKRMKG